MKTLVYFILPSLIFFNSFSSFSQETCKVLIPEIADNYEGKCKKGLAHGKGIAKGKDKYVGRFKNGFPDGKGKYIWSTGEIYDGAWSKGKRNGRGKFSSKINGLDSTSYGIWEDDLFVKEILPDPYKVVRTTSISRYNVQRRGDGDRILFTIMKSGNQSNIYSNLSFSSTSGTSLSVGSKIGFENIMFPFGCRITFTMPGSFGGTNIEVEFEIEIIQAGQWEITINN